MAANEQNGWLRLNTLRHSRQQLFMTSVYLARETLKIENDICDRFSY